MSNRSEHTDWLSLLQYGQHYMKTWPNDKRLAAVFPENRVSTATRFAIRVMPPLAIMTLSWQIALGGLLGTAAATALFACSLPLQGLWWLGKRSMTPLPPALLHWFYEVTSRLEQAGQKVMPVEGHPTYQALANVLKRAFNQQDHTFLDRL